MGSISGRCEDGNQQYDRTAVNLRRKRELSKDKSFVIIGENKEFWKSSGILRR